jgi:hypothetical protein
MKQVAMTPIKG